MYMYNQPRTYNSRKAFNFYNFQISYFQSVITSNHRHLINKVPICSCVNVHSAFLLLETEKKIAHD